ncbi:hypothetical protein [[Clostridium] hylemonae]|uniref:hypothetical protein n=1 Tax=[Clostridium] hylemonae TaxID=89153 RepID=UPI001D08642A|nr:hypothetical protein [[Clostridium] hylemonae]MCB7520783.1 hypothetical protein [[Clostridium] hylemonae]
MDERILQIAEQIVRLNQKACEVYLPLVDDVCSRIVSEDELSKVLELYKRVCRRYLYAYPSCIKFYVEAYRKMWEEESFPESFLLEKY